MSFFKKISNLFRGKPKPQLSLEEAGALLDRLIELGYLKFVSPEEKIEVRAHVLESLVQHGILNSGPDDVEAVTSWDRRHYSTDGEDLSEGSAGVVLTAMLPVLRQEGVEIESIEDDFTDDYYRVILDGISYSVVEFTDAEDQDTWGEAHVGLLKILNTLLETAGSPERAYALYCGGNDAYTVLLTPEMREVFQAAPNLDARELPRSAEELSF